MELLSIIFPDGKEFSATNPSVPPLLTVNVQQPMGLKFEGESGIITNAADLAVAARKSLSLSGSEIATTGNLTAPGGRGRGTRDRNCSFIRKWNY